MFLISIGTDRKIFEEGSLIRKRQVEYGELFDATHIIVWNEKKKGAYQNMSIRDNVFLYPTNSKNKLFYILNTFINLFYCFFYSLRGELFSVFQGCLGNTNPK